MQQREEVVDIGNASKRQVAGFEEFLQCAKPGHVRRCPHRPEQHADQRHAHQRFKAVAERHGEIDEIHTFVEGACLAAGQAVFGLRDRRREATVDEQLAADRNIEFEGPGVQLSGRCRQFEPRPLLAFGSRLELANMAFHFSLGCDRP